MNIGKKFEIEISIKTYSYMALFEIIISTKDVLIQMYTIIFTLSSTLRK